ncbi:MAG TPA: DUF2336 domain-containing protein [Pseudolabrys sp.]|jgi:uncharacterized protein (DUF2336 family)|nr:DUF2336 domain-containing protein [Pseudolabrys sp.]
MPNAALRRDIAPAAASFSLIDELNDAVAAGDAKRRLRIMLRIADLFAAGARNYSGQQIAVFDDVLQELTADIELGARAELAHRLARIDGAPPRVVRSLAFDDAIEVAGPVLTHSAQLTDGDLIENASTKSQAHLLAIAQRLQLSEAVTDVLVARGDRRVVNKVVRNRGARFSLAGYEKLTVHARRDKRLTLALGRRGDLPRQCFIKLLEAASASVRARLEAEHPQAEDAIRDVVDDVATLMQREARAGSEAHAAAARDAKSRFRVAGASEASVHAPARAQEFEKTVVALARLGRFPVDLVERALLDEGEDMVLLFAKAAGCSWTTTRELLTMYAANRKLTPDDMTRSFERFDKLSRKTAQSIVSFQAHSQKQRAHGEAPDGSADLTLLALAADRSGATVTQQ